MTSSISRANISASQLNLYATSDRSDAQGARAGAKAGGAAGRSTSLFDSVIQALSQVGGTDMSSAIKSGSGAQTSAIDGSSPTDVQSALRDFMQNLMAALHSQNPRAGSAASDSDGAASTGIASAGKAGAYRHHGHMAQDLQSLILQLSASSSGDSSTSSDASSDSGSGVAASADYSGLQQSFDNLMSALGADSTDGSSGQARLTGFLQALSGDLSQGNGKVGVVDTHA